MVDEAIKASILKRLEEIEKENKFRILYACETGSRAWGFESPDSDYDVRFIYVHERDWYADIHLESKRDTYEELNRDTNQDFAGWELLKTLKLLYKSNPSLIERLGSPILYRKDEAATQMIQDLITQYYSIPAAGYHYLNMAKGNYGKYLRDKDEVFYKKYLYVIRPLLAVKWILQRSEPVPVLFETLVEGTVTDKEFLTRLEGLLDRKKAGGEKKLEPCLPFFNEFIEAELKKRESKGFPKIIGSKDRTALNEVYTKLALRL